MSLTNCYTSLEVLRARLNTPVSSTLQDELLEGVIESVSRAIDEETGTQFFAATQTRYYTANCFDELLVDDLLSLTTLKTDMDGDGTWETTWRTVDYLLSPYNAPTLSTPRPYWKIQRTVLSSFFFPTGIPMGVQVLGSWGFCTEVNRPKMVETVCLRECVWHVHAIKAPYGRGVGEDEAPTAPIGLSRASCTLLAPYRRVPMG